MSQPPVYRVRISPRALADPDAIHAYLAAVSPKVAADTVAKRIGAIDSLRLFPHRYAVPRTGKPRGATVRSMPVRPGLVRYRIEEQADRVRVPYVRHGARCRP